MPTDESNQEESYGHRGILLSNQEKENRNLRMKRKKEKEKGKKGFNDNTYGTFFCCSILKNTINLSIYLCWVFFASAFKPVCHMVILKAGRVKPSRFALFHCHQLKEFLLQGELSAFAQEICGCMSERQELYSHRKRSEHSSSSAQEMRLDCLMVLPRTAEPSSLPAVFSLPLIQLNFPPNKVMWPML